MGCLQSHASTRHHPLLVGTLRAGDLESLPARLCGDESLTLIVTLSLVGTFRQEDLDSHSSFNVILFSPFLTRNNPDLSPETLGDGQLGDYAAANAAVDSNAASFGRVEPRRRHDGKAYLTQFSQLEMVTKDHLDNLKKSDHGEALRYLSTPLPTGLTNIVKSGKLGIVTFNLTKVEREDRTVADEAKSRPGATPPESRC
ncbi:hypothetical protein BCR34DRAFT_597792 [Clohesyomyces aquaticus]|uniref:Uncharacterized protein n=1 Tax=Clohesyomyces aquaticus TaxID=1231657 RepID=A0A1Y2A149_9PLEO|nr:hypothetical protein BCR34DRAFT_597792 [Clohesyomyces aquaticus]